MEDSAAGKSALLSKTYGFNLAVALAAENFPQVNAWVSLHPQTALTLFAAANMVLRHLTKGPLRYAFTPKPPVPPTP